MARNCRFFLIIVFCLFAAGCVSNKITPGQMGSVKNIGVIGAVPDTFQLKTVGLTVFSNDNQSMGINGWGLTQFAVDKAAAAVPSKFTVTKIPAKPEDLIRPDTLRFLYDPKVDLENDVRKLLADKPQLDAYIVLTPGNLQDPIRGTNQVYGPIGAYHLIPGLSDEATFVFAFIRVTILDRSFHTVATRFIGVVPPKERMGGGKLFETIDTDEFRYLPGWKWEPNPTSVSSAQREEFKQALFALIGEAIPYTLQIMKINEL